MGDRICDRKSVMTHFIAQNEIAVSSPAHDSRMLLVLNIIEDHFGSQTREIAGYLLLHQDVTLQKLESNFCTKQRKLQFRLTKESLCSSLLVLQQHECLICELPPNQLQNMNAMASTSSNVGSERRMATSSNRERIIYSIDSRMVLNRLLIGRIIHHANCITQLEGIGELIVEELFMNGKQSFQQLRADVDARLTAEAHKKKSGLNERDLQFKKIQQAFDVLAERGLIVIAKPLKVNRQSIKVLPPKSRGAKNKRHLLGTFGEVSGASGVGAKRGRGFDDYDDLGSDDEDDDDDLPIEMRRPRARSSSSTVGSRFVGDGEWKEDCGFGPTTEELIYDADAEWRAKNASANDVDGMLAGGSGLSGEIGADSNVRVKVEDLTGDDSATQTSVPTTTSTGGISVNKLVIHSDDEDDVKMDVTSSTSLAGDQGDSAQLDWRTVGGALQQKSPDAKHCLWMIGWNQLIHEERHLACIQYTTERMQTKAGRVVKIILDATTKSHQYQVPIGTSELSAPLKMLTIFDEYRKCWGVEKAVQPEDTLSAGSSSSNAPVAPISNSKMPINSTEKVLDLPTLRTLLKVLIDDRCLTETSTSSSSGSSNSKDLKEYQVNVGEIINKIKRKTFQSIAAARFGVSTARIIELLTSHDELIEQQQLSDLAIMPAREARENLYKLYKDKWVDYRDISKRLDYNPASTYYFWHLDQSKLKATVLDHSHKSILNMRIR